MRSHLSLARAAALAALAPLGIAGAQGLAAVGPVDPNHGFPQWYEDANGLQLAPCITDVALCGMAGPVELIDPALPFPDNYGGVFADHVFYGAVEASMPTNAGGQALFVLTVQGGFTNDLELPVDGEQDVFARIRLRVDNLIQGQTYVCTTPAGVYTFVAENSAVRGINFTDDVGRLSGDFAAALGGATGPWLQWDSDLPITDLAGREYIGNPAIAHTITGSPFGTNFFRIEGPSVGGPGVNMVETDLFTVIGVKAQATEPPPPPVAPVANFSAAPLSGTEPLEVSFTDLSTGSITARSWDFGDLSGSTLQNPVHSYAAGIYTVSLTVTGPGGSDTLTMTDLIAVAEQPPVGNGLVLAQPNPGVAGVPNALMLSGGTPGRVVGVYTGMNLGATILNLGNCGGIPLGLRSPFRLLAKARVEADGTAILIVRPPATAAGKTFHFQAIEPFSCRTSNIASDVL